MFGRPGNVSIDFYRTDFQNQVVVDWDNPRKIRFSTLEGASYANSLQIELNHELLPNLELRTAYKFYDVKTQYQSGLLQKPLVARNRFFANLGYETNVKDNGAQWRFDYTLHTLGEQRLPDTSSNPAPLRIAAYSRSWWSS